MAPELSVAAAHTLAKEVNHKLLHRLQYLAGATIYVNPAEESGERYHRFTAHAHDGLPVYSY